MISVQKRRQFEENPLRIPPVKQGVLPLAFQVHDSGSIDLVCCENSGSCHTIPTFVHSNIQNSMKKRPEHISGASYMFRHIHILHIFSGLIHPDLKF